jgi:hypothetical protein
MRYYIVFKNLEQHTPGILQCLNNEELLETLPIILQNHQLLSITSFEDKVPVWYSSKDSLNEEIYNGPQENS